MLFNKNFFTQTLCWEYYSKIKNYVVMQFIKDPILSPKIEIKKLKNVRM